MREHVVSQNCIYQPEFKEYYPYNIHYTIASTPQLIKQYYFLLENVYNDYFANDYQVTPQEHMHNNLYGKIIVAINDAGQVIGGARLLTSHPNKPCQLLLEYDTVNLKTQFPHLQLCQYTYSEWGRFVIAKSLPGKSVISENIARMCVRTALEDNSRYLFGLPILSLKKRYEQIFKNMGLEFSELIAADQMPAHYEIDEFKPYLSMVDLYNTDVSSLRLLDSNHKTMHCTF